jgi:hypothetical protein
MMIYMKKHSPNGFILNHLTSAFSMLFEWYVPVYKTFTKRLYYISNNYSINVK